MYIFQIYSSNFIYNLIYGALIMNKDINIFIAFA